MAISAPKIAILSKKSYLVGRTIAAVRLRVNTTKVVCNVCSGGLPRKVELIGLRDISHFGRLAADSPGFCNQSTHFT